MTDFKQWGKIPEVNDRLKISVRCFEIWPWRSFNIFVGMLSRPIDLLLLREEIILKISSSVIWLNMMDSWTLRGKKSEKDSLENYILDCIFWITVEKKSLKTLAIERGSAIKFPLWMIDIGESLLRKIFHRHNRFNTFSGFFNVIIITFEQISEVCLLRIFKESWE